MRIADTAPAYCSGCFTSKPADRHVDFDVAWDGPTITDGISDGDGGITHTIPTAIDDLVLCEECLRNAAGLVGLTDPGETAGQIEQLTEANRVLAEKVRGLEDYNTKLGAALGARPAQERKPRQKVAA